MLEDFWIGFRYRVTCFGPSPMAGVGPLSAELWSNDSNSRPSNIDSLNLIGNGNRPYRQTDLKVEWITPEANSAVYSPSMIQCWFRVHNDGPDIMYSKDTIEYALWHRFAPTLQYRKRWVGQRIDPGRYIDIYDSIYINVPSAQEDFFIAFGQRVTVRGPKPRKEILHMIPEDITTDSNSGPILYLNHKGLVSAKNRFEINNYRIYPNPATDAITIDISGPAYTICFGRGPILKPMVRLINAKGEIVNQFVVSGDTCTLDVSGFASGVYILQIVSHLQTYNNQIIIK